MAVGPVMSSATPTLADGANGPGHQINSVERPNGLTIRLLECPIDFPWQAIHGPGGDLTAMSQPTILAEAIGKPLKHVGFKKKTDTWYLDCDDTITVLNLQKSSYGPKYYINIGIWLKCIGEADMPRTSKCHIQFRWESLIPQDEKQLELLLDLDNRLISDQDRAYEISKMLETYFAPFLSNATSIEGLRSFYKSEGWPSCLVTVRAQEILGGIATGS